MAKTRILFEHESDRKSGGSGSVLLGFALAIGLGALLYFVFHHPEKAIEFFVKIFVQLIR